jgi:hypothetical protein
MITRPTKSAIGNSGTDHFQSPIVTGNEAKTTMQV